MFYGMCMKCGDRWEIGDTPVCKCRKQRSEVSRDDIINMAAQAGISEAIWFYDHDVLEKFAALVAEREREACAKLCEEQMKSYMSKRYTTDPLGGFQERFAAERCAEAIRARGDV